jgi:hypothetical protein
MPLGNVGRELFQTTIKNLSTHFRLVIVDDQGNTTFSTPQAITFSAVDAIAGMRTFDAYTTAISLSGAAFKEVTTVQLCNSTASTIYMSSSFGTAQRFTSDGIFSLTAVIVSFL